jgi:hypothetical protein
VIETYNFPKISCLLVTADDRLEYFRRSYECYRKQTYPNRELVIVNEGSKAYQDSIFEIVRHQLDIKLIFLEGKYTLGALRNISVSLCNGEIWVQWDDDDFNVRERLTTQYQHLKSSGKRVSFLSDQLHYYFPTKQMFWENWREHSGGQTRYALIPGTCMCWKNFKVKYPSSGFHASAGEDSVMTNKICEDDSRVNLVYNQGFMQVYSYHGKNVWDLEHHQSISQKRSVPIQFLLQHRDRIRQTLDELQLDTNIHVMGRDGLAFIYQ